ncbi:flippase [Colwellia sp. C1TZA3]|uniref:flippase n=1 Tax=Colwellia sp. C1TZA3 TaxID=2508879 RepID=UPI0011B9EBCF|nr:flippase [Colwellia sp. C1TZA3]TWX67501.1 flippase [Colwellia sp. C1TZA3]
MLNRKFTAETKNVIWLFLEKIVTMFVLVLVNIVIARSVGPELFGQLSYLLVFINIVIIISPLGINAIFIKEIVAGERDKGTIIGTCLLLRLFGALLSVVIVTVLAKSELLTAVDPTLLIGAALVGCSSVLYLFDYWFQAKVLSKYSVVVRVSTIIVFSVIKLWLVVTGKSFNYLLIVFMIEPLIMATGYSIAYKLSLRGSKNPKWSVDLTYGLALLKRSWWLIFSAIASVICLKIDQLMIAEMIGNTELGIYSVAVRLSEVWYFFPTAIAASYFSSLIKLRQKSSVLYQQRLQWLCDWLFITALSLSVVMYFFAKPLISLLYGQEYEAAASVLVVHMWAAVIVFMRALFSKWIINESAYKFSLITHGTAAIINVILNLLLIPDFGAMGAAWSTLLSYIVGSYLVIAIPKKTRPFFIIMSKSLLLPVTVIRLYKSFLLSKYKHESSA